jgi:hypothetical protein
MKEAPERTRRIGTELVALWAVALGQTTQLRWRSGYDNSVSPTGAGWRIDAVLVCSMACPTGLLP